MYGLTALDELQALTKLVAIVLLIEQVRFQSFFYIQRLQMLSPSWTSQNLQKKEALGK